MGGRDRRGAAGPARMVDVEYAGRLEAIVFRLSDGRVAGVGVERIDGLDTSPLTRVTLFDEGESLLLEQFSGNSVEVPAMVLAERAGAQAAEGRPTPVRPGGGARTGAGAGRRRIASVRSGRYRDPL